MQFLPQRPRHRENALLAIQGGEPTIKHPLPPMYPGGMRLGREEEDAVLAVLRSKRLFRYYGPHEGSSQVDEFETAFSKHIGAQHCLAVSSGFGALVSGLLALGVGPGDEVIVPAYTWIASAQAVIAVGGVPVIAEIDDSLTIDPEDVASKITSRTKVIMPVHMRGAPCKMDQIIHLAGQRRLKVLEDVAQAAGGKFFGRSLGALGNVGAFSFQFNKIITSGEGGAVTTNDQHIHHRTLMAHDVAGALRKGVPEHESLNGFNFRMGEIQGALLQVQLGRLALLLEDMRRHKAALKAALGDVISRKGASFRTINDPSGDTAIALVLLMPSANAATQVTTALNAEGLPSFVIYDQKRPDYHVYAHWTPVIEKRIWSAEGGPWRWHEGSLPYSLEMCPRSLDILGRAVHIDISPDLSAENIGEMIDATTKVLEYVL
jgi:8-amino-3,8-dideoxy-alpha-D-manno-octulosonate transaminase